MVRPRLAVTETMHLLAHFLYAARRAPSGRGALPWRATVGHAAVRAPGPRRTCCCSRNLDLTSVEQLTGARNASRGAFLRDIGVDRRTGGRVRGSTPR